MAVKIGFVDNTTATGPNTLAHHNMLDQIRRFCAGEGQHVITAQPGSPKGALTNFRVLNTGVTETWTITCTAAAANGGTFSVSGSVSGAQAAATVGVEYNSGEIAFTITDGATDFIVGDVFTVSAVANAATIPNEQAYTGAGNGTLTGFFAYDPGQGQTWTLTCKTSATNGGVFSVVGSTSGPQADATVGVLYNSATIKFTINDGSNDFQVGDKFVLVPGQWKVLRWNDGGGTITADRELILQGSGHSGQEEIFIGFRTNHLESADYYNMSSAVFTGYVPSAAFTLQPGYSETGFCAHNIRLDYWLLANRARVAATIKIATPIYECFYAGKFLPYGNPGQYPYPVVSVGTFAARTTTRFSDTAHTMGYRGGSALKMRFVDGTIKSPECMPWCQFGSAPVPRDTNSVWGLNPIVMNDTTQGLYGEFEGVYQVTGFNNVVENTITIGAQDYAVMQDTYRTGFHDYYALELK
jgi:hypothetical protein